MRVYEGKIIIEAAVINCNFMLQAAAKDVPEWMKYSTVHPSGDHVQDPASTDQLSDTVKTDAPSSALLPGQSSLTM